MQPTDIGEPDFALSIQTRPSRDGIMTDIKRVPHYLGTREPHPNLLLGEEQIGFRDKVTTERGRQSFPVALGQIILRPPARIIRLTDGDEGNPSANANLRKFDRR